ncbi:MAG: hypothetical protein DI548_11180 [Flavobacterium johnsoniae]|nr:MAG: hypothetical protein DI548_11180 [Flavobacterium johnsoniae]
MDLRFKTLEFVKKKNPRINPCKSAIEDKILEFVYRRTCFYLCNERQNKILDLRFKNLEFVKEKIRV